MEIAIKEAKNGIEKGNGGPFGSVIVKDGKIISKGHNRVVKNNDPTCHGEIDAIRKACKKLGTFNLSDCEIYTTGEPCPMCLGAILWSNIKKIYYGCSIDDNSAIGFRDKLFEKFLPHKKLLNTQQIDRDECFALFKEYRRIRDKTKY